MPSSSIEEIVRRNRQIISGARARIALSRDLRETSRNLIQANADLREFLRETLLVAMSRHEHRSET